jgi:hypothetical protein
LRFSLQAYSGFDGTQVIPRASRLGVVLVLLVLASMVAGLVDAAARIGLVGPTMAAATILASLLGMAVAIGAASSSHRALVINAALAAAVVIAAHMAFVAVVKG